MHRKWLFKLFATFSILLLLATVFYKLVVVDRVYSNLDYTISESTENLFIGASHFAVGINTDLLPNSENLSVSGMPYYFTYPKAKRILQNNPGVENLFISLSVIHVGPYGDSILMTDEGPSRENAFTFFPTLESYADLNERIYSLDFILAYMKYEFGVPFNYMDDAKLALTSFRRKLNIYDFDLAGSFSSLSLPGERLITEEEVREKAQFYFGQFPTRSEISISSVRSIAKMTEEMGINLYIVNMPANETFRNLVPQDHLQTYDQLITDVLNNYPHVKYLNYYELSLDQFDYLDGDHVNSAGAVKVTERLAAEVFSL